MPENWVEFALKRPIFRLFHQLVLDGVVPKIKPLLPVTFAAAQLAVEKILLPNWFLGRVRPAASHLSTPELNPLLQRHDGHRSRGAEKMKVIRHDGVATNQPAIRLAPGIEQQGNYFRLRQQRTAFVNADGNKLEDGLIHEFPRGQVRQLLTSGVTSWCLHFLFGTRGTRPSDYPVDFKSFSNVAARSPRRACCRNTWRCCG